MSTGLEFSDEVTRRLERMYSTRDVMAQRAETLNALALQPGESVLDIGSGPGFLAHEMGRVVGPRGRVRGIDISESMVALARSRCADHSWVTIESGKADRLPFPDAHFDAAVSVQVYEYVDDISAALSEVHRVLRPGGRVAILDTDWDSIVWHTSDPARLGRILAAWDEHLVDPHLPRTLGTRLKQAGFRTQRCSVHTLLNTDYDPGTFSYGMSDLIAEFVSGRGKVTPAEVGAWIEDLRALKERGEYFFSLNRYLFLAVR
jgi:arsenite methyltransferase